LLGLDRRCPLAGAAGLFKALPVWLRSPIQSLHDQSRAPVPLNADRQSNKDTLALPAVLLVETALAA
jgi:hypothetical protein